MHDNVMVGGMEILDALKDALGGWRYIRNTHGDLYGVGWNRVEDKLVSAIASISAAPTSREDLYETASEAFNDAYDGASDGGGTRAALRHVVDCILAAQAGAQP